MKEIPQIVNKELAKYFYNDWSNKNKKFSM